MKTYRGASDDLHAACLPHTTLFKPTGEKRPIEPGEWYLSGAKPCAYRAPNGTSHAYHVCRPVAQGGAA